MRGTHSNQGFALAAAIFALVVLGILATGGFYLARQESRIGVASQRATAAFYVAEQGLSEVMSEWDMATFGALSDWSMATVTDSTEDGVWSVNVTKMTDRLYFLNSTGGVPQGSAVYGGSGRMLGVVARLSSPDLKPEAALTTRGKVDIRGTAEVHGEDQTPPGWGAHCSSYPLEDHPGILINKKADVGYKGDGSLSGNPEIQEADPPLTDQYFTEFGDLSWDELVAEGARLLEAREAIEWEIRRRVVPTTISDRSSRPWLAFTASSGSANHWAECVGLHPMPSPAGSCR